MICPVELAGDLSALRAARAGEHAKHVLLPEGRDGAGDESTGSDFATHGEKDHVVASGGEHRQRRPRRPLPGMLLHIDGSRHRWFQDERWYDLIVILDDATSEIYYAELVEEESTATVMAALRAVVERQGLFCALYSDRGSHFWLTPKAGEAVDPHRLTQVGRALRELGIRMIPAYSPQARGRSERNFGTWQGRLPQELCPKGRAPQIQILTSFWLACSRARRKASGKALSRSVATSECSPTVSRATSPARPWRCTATRTASKIRSGFCAIKPAIIPVRMSPVPPVAIPGLPVVLTQTVPSG